MEISSLSDCNVTQTYNHLVRKRNFNHLIKLSKSFSCVVSTYLYGAFECMFLSCHVRISDESTLYNSMNVKKFHAQNRRKILRLSGLRPTITQFLNKHSIN